MIQTLTSGSQLPTNTPNNQPSPANSRAPQARSFEEIAADYWSDEGRGSALDYLKGLSRTDLQTVGNQHRFADPIPQLIGITSEGANNLLRPKGETIDENRDGIDTIGEAHTFRFPNSNTPENVKAAWEETLAESGGEEHSLLMSTLFLPLPQFETDDNGRITRVINPGDPDYRNRMAEPGYSYARTVENKLRALDDPSNPPADYRYYLEAKEFYQNLLANFERHGVR